MVGSLSAKGEYLNHVNIETEEPEARCVAINQSSLSPLSNYPCCRLKGQFNLDIKVNSAGTAGLPLY